jgi:3-methyladenine DNA glycosylase AlkD
MTARDALRRLRSLGDAKDAEFLQRFFKTGPGEYGEGDRFLGVRVPVTRRVAREFRDLSVDETLKLLAEPWHEARLLAVILLAHRYERGDAQQREAVYRAYLANARRVNNWDLVDSSARDIVGEHLMRRPRSPLDTLARSKDLWERRIAIIATHAFIRAGEYDDTLRIAERLLDDPHDLIHKAVGWMLREVGDRDRPTLERFLAIHAGEMPRTMLRYAIEKFPQEQRKRIMAVGRAGRS